MNEQSDEFDDQADILSTSNNVEPYVTDDWFVVNRLAGSSSTDSHSSTSVQPSVDPVLENEENSLIEEAQVANFQLNSSNSSTEAILFDVNDDDGERRSSSGSYDKLSRSPTEASFCNMANNDNIGLDMVTLPCGRRVANLPSIDLGQPSIRSRGVANQSSRSGGTLNWDQLEASVSSSVSDVSFLHADDDDLLQASNFDPANQGNDVDYRATFSDELPVNFVQTLTNRIRNYYHCEDSHFNRNLTLAVLFAVAVVAGVAYGHYKGVQARSDVSCPIAHNNIINSERFTENSIVKDPPAKPARSDGTSAEVSNELIKQLKVKLSALEERYDDINLNLESEKKTKQQQNTHLAVLINQTAMLMHNLSSLREREKLLLVQEQEMKKVVLHLETVVDKLAGEVREQRRSESKRTADATCSSTSGDCPSTKSESSSESDDNSQVWQKLQTLFESIKDASNVTEILNAYSWLLGKMDLPDLPTNWNAALQDEVASFKKSFSKMQNIVGSKIDQVGGKLKDVDLQSYLERTQNHLHNFWAKASKYTYDATRNHRIYAAKLSKKIEQQFGSLGDAGIDDRWAGLRKQWDDELVESEQINPVEDESKESDEAFTINFNLFDHDTESYPSEVLPDDLSKPRRDDRDNDVEVVAEERDLSNAEINSNTLRHESRALRDGLKRMKFTRQLREAIGILDGDIDDDDDVGRIYLSKLKRLYKSMHLSTADIQWWVCQKNWWSMNIVAYEDQCRSKLQSWQQRSTGERSWVKPELFWPQLKPVVEKWGLVPSELRGHTGQYRQQNKKDGFKNVKYDYDNDRRKSTGNKKLSGRDY